MDISLVLDELRVRGCLFLLRRLLGLLRSGLGSLLLLSGLGWLLHDWSLLWSLAHHWVLHWVHH